MKNVSEYIIHRSIDMNELVQMITRSLQAGLQPYGNLIAVPVTTNAVGSMIADGALGGTPSISYIQAMVRYAN